MIPDSSAAERAPTLKRISKLPLYLQVSQWLEDKIASGHYKPGARLPGDNELAQQFGVSIITVRAAMRVLIEKQLIVRYPGRGTFMVDRNKVRAVWNLGSVDDLVLVGLQSSLKISSMGLTVAPTWAASKMGLGPREKAQWLRTIRFADKDPFLVTDIYLRAHIGKLLKNIDLQEALKEEKLVSALVEQRSGLRITEIYQTMSAERADKNTARDLGVKAGTPLLVIDREYYTEDMVLVQMGRSHYRVDYYRYTMNLKRSPPGAR